MGGIERAYGCIRFRGAENSGPEAGFDHVNVHTRGPEGTVCMAVPDDFLFFYSGLYMNMHTYTFIRMKKRINIMS